MKKIISVAMTAILTASLFTGCGTVPPTDTTARVPDNTTVPAADHSIVDNGSGVAPRTDNAPAGDARGIAPADTAKNGAAAKPNPAADKRIPENGAVMPETVK